MRWKYGFFHGPPDGRIRWHAPRRETILWLIAADAEKCVTSPAIFAQAPTLARVRSSLSAWPAHPFLARLSANHWASERAAREAPTMCAYISCRRSGVVIFMELISRGTRVPLLGSRAVRLVIIDHFALISLEWKLERISREDSISRHSSCHITVYL